MVVTQKMFSDLVNQINASFERIEKRLEELESKAKPTTTPRKTTKS
jgi:ubiquinone biosynthesis protein UbiJ